MSKDKPRYWADFIILGVISLIPAVWGWSDMANDPTGRWMFIMFILVFGYIIGVLFTEKRTKQ